ncbi:MULTISPECIES: sporulation-specific diadenylate cyclase CdaS [Metabacillus]|uniref:sporulation-specific diadenylate cyclase CdaS n=1 Tax=Metabacillus TaxID=2675233 RepID=UPI003B832A21
MLYRERSRKSLKKEIMDPIKKLIYDQLGNIIDESMQLMNSLQEKDHCLLCELEDLHKIFQQLQSQASSFYLQSYLSEYTPHYAILSKVIQHLSAQKHGGLIVIERNDQLVSFLKNGVPIDAYLSASLLESIFYPGNSLHDGAVLVSGTKIISAANVLPLSTKTADAKIGTRHRAAIGITESTDAIALVVSEETGKMSFAINGGLYPFSSE